MSDIDLTGGRTRKDMLRAGLLAGGAAVGGSLLAGGSTGRAADAGDVKVLRFALDLEHLTAAFYAASLRANKLTGEIKNFATVAGEHERAHVDLLTKTLGAEAPAARNYDFGAATDSDAAFLKAAVTLEDIATRAYNAGAMGLTPATLAAAAKIASVEARHAAWVRDLAGLNPAPDATEPVVSTAEVAAAVQRTGYIR